MLSPSVALLDMVTALLLIKDIYLLYACSDLRGAHAPYTPFLLVNETHIFKNI